MGRGRGGGEGKKFSRRVQRPVLASLGSRLLLCHRQGERLGLHSSLAPHPEVLRSFLGTWVFCSGKWDGHEPPPLPFQKDTFGTKVSLLQCPVYVLTSTLRPLQRIRVGMTSGNPAANNSVSRCKAPLRASGNPTLFLVA